MKKSLEQLQLESKKRQKEIRKMKSYCSAKIARAKYRAKKGGRINWKKIQKYAQDMGVNKLVKVSEKQ